MLLHIAVILGSLLYSASSTSLSGLRSLGQRAKCPPKPPTITEFDAASYLGKWYEQKRIPASFQLDTSCVRAVYGLNDNGDVSVHNTATNKDGSFEEAIGYAYVPDPAYPGELLVQFPGSPVAGSYWILETDYENYSLVYSCVDYVFGLIHFEFAWILAREQNLDPELIQHGVDVFAMNGVDISLLEDTVQNADCFYGD